MPLEIDILSIGNADAIIVQVYDNTSHATILIDGGNADDGELVVSHIHKWAKGKVDLLVSTHPDSDHVDGLSTVVNRLPVGQVLIHDPSAHRQDLRGLMLKFSQSSYRATQAVFKSLATAGDFINLVDRKRIPRSEPFSGLSYSLPDNASLTVVGPTANLYNQLLAGIDDAVKQSEQAELQEWVQKQLGGQLGSSGQLYAKSKTPEEVIDEKDEESPSNNSSALILLTYRGANYLFTADAGPVAFDSARQSYNLSNLRWMQVPHHGSRRNLTSELISYFNPIIAYVSAQGGDDDKHPNPNIVQAFRNVNTPVYGTNKSGSLWHHNDTPNENRAGYVSAAPL